MVSFYALSIFLLPIMTIFCGDFWNDVDTIQNELSDRQDLPTQTTPNEVQLAASTFEVPQHSFLTNQLDDKQLRRREFLKRKPYEKTVTLSATEVENFKQTIITDESYPQNISLTEIEEKLLALGLFHEWFDLDTYDVDEYSRYWGKVCVAFWDKPLVKNQRYACVIYPSYGVSTKRKLNTRDMIQHLDLLNCRCHMYEHNYKNNVTAPETFLIHKYSEHEYIAFDQDETMENRYTLSIKEFKGGITLPEPVAEELSKYRSTFTRNVGKHVTLGPYKIHRFNQSLKFDESYPNNISTMEIGEKLLQFGDVHQWPNLQKYDYEMYSKYWAKVCVFFWGKQLNNSHRQSCIIYPSYKTNSVRKLFVSDRVLNFDLLSCKCHSYTTNYKKPVSAADTFFVHQHGKNEYIIFEQRATENTTYTLIIKDFKGGIILPDPDVFNY